MTTERERVAIYDDYIKTGSDLYAISAIRAVSEVGLQPQVFKDLKVAEQFLFRSGGDVKALICPLGSKSMGSFSTQYPAQHLLRHARNNSIPVALMSGSQIADRYIVPDNGDIVVPKQPSEQITPTLIKWLFRLAT